MIAKIITGSLAITVLILAYCIFRPKTAEATDKFTIPQSDNAVDVPVVMYYASKGKYFVSTSGVGTEEITIADYKKGWEDYVNVTNALNKKEE